MKQSVRDEKGKIVRWEEQVAKEPAIEREEPPNGKVVYEEGTDPVIPAKAGIERELRVVRVGPNPRMVVCEYWEVLERRRCVVKVGNNRKWLKGMVFRMEEPVSEHEYQQPWNYRGRVPRRKGRW